MSQDPWEQICYSEGWVDNEGSMGSLLPELTMLCRTQKWESGSSISLFSQISSGMQNIQDFPNLSVCENVPSFIDLVQVLPSLQKLSWPSSPNFLPQICRVNSFIFVSSAYTSITAMVMSYSNLLIYLSLALWFCEGTSWLDGCMKIDRIFKCS